MRSLILFAVLLLSLACQREPVKVTPFSGEIAGIPMYFPLTVGQLRQRINVKQKHEGQLFLEDSLKRIEWYYDWRKKRADNKVDTEDSLPIYGVVVLLRRKAADIIQYRKLFEKQFHASIHTLAIENINLDEEREYISIRPTFTFLPARGIRFSMREAACLVDYPYQCTGIDSETGMIPFALDNPEKMLRIAISYGLQPDEEERFAAGDGSRIWQDTD